MSLSDLPASVVQAAQQYVASLGIANAQQQQDAVLDYVLGGGSPATLASDATPAAALSTSSLQVTGAPPAELLGVAGPIGPVSIGAATTSVSFTVFLNTARADDVVVDWAVPAGTSIDQLGAADFGGTLPSGSVTIPAGATSASFAVTVPGTLRLPVETLGVDISSAALDLTLANATGGATLNSTVPVKGVDAIAALVQVGGPGTLTGAGQSYTLDLGTIGADGVPAAALLVDNIAPADADTLGGSFAVSGGSGFTFALPSIAGVTPSGTQGGLSIRAATTLGSHTETLTFTPTQTNASGFSGTLAPVTLVVTDTVVPPTAQPASTPGTIAITARLGGGSTGSVTLANAAPIGSDALGVVLGDSGGDVLVPQTGALAPGAATAVALTSVARTAGTFTDTLSIGYTSVAPSGSGHASAALGGATVTLDGTVYQPAVASLQTLTLDLGTVHQGDATAFGSIVLANTVAPGAYSDSLLAQAAAAATGLVSGIGSLAIAPGAAGTLTVGLDTSRAGTLSATETILLASHDPAQPDSPLGSLAVSVTGTVVGDALPAFVELSGGGTVSGTAGGNAVLDLGVLQPGAAPVKVVIAVANAAQAPADSLDGALSFTAQGVTVPLAGFTGVAPGAQSGSYTFTVTPSAPGTITDTITLDPTDPVTGALREQVLTLEAEVACFLRGTRILTARGEVAVEDLRVGEPVVTLAGRGGVLRPVTWIGRSGFDARRHPRPHEAWPVRVRAGALADCVPVRDLLVSPGHALLLDGVLVQAERLVNGATIVQDRSIPQGEYFHVELDGHDVLLADGAPAETYLDTGNRHVFEPAGTLRALHPDFSATAWPGPSPRQPCRPLVTEGPVLARVKARLLARVHAAGFRSDHDPHCHLLTASGQVVLPQTPRDAPRTGAPHSATTRHRFVLPADAGPLRLVSRSWVPSHHDPASTDLRELGVCVARLLLDDAREVALATLGGGEGRPGGGWNAGEASWRWTDGCASLPPATRSVTVELRGSATYWAPHEARAGTPSRLRDVSGRTARGPAG